MAMNKELVLNNAAHALLLKKHFPQGTVSQTFPSLLWECELVPNPLSLPYQIKITYQAGSPPVITVVGERLSCGALARLPHVYSQERQKLCLHYPPEKKWTPAINIADSIVPWAAEWLFHYEIWVNTGVWNGGGNEH